MTDRVVAEVFPPGIFIKEELDARGWTQEDLVQILGRSSYARLISEVINAKRSITPETAAALGEAFGTGAEYWLNLQTAYQLARTRPESSGIARRARLYAKAPIKHLLRRKWIEESPSLDVLERRVLEFYQIASLEEQPEVWRAAARTGAVVCATLTTEQQAWLMQAKHLAATVQATPFTDQSLEEALPRLRLLLPQEVEVGSVARILADAGIRLVVVEHLPGSRIDGACLWLDDTAPVIALSLRYDRLDYFWHTLLHEIKHVMNRDGLRQHAPLDVDLVGQRDEPGADRFEHERDADRYAADFLIPTHEMDDFIARCRPLFSTRQIIGFATRVGVHPAIVVGQLHFRKAIPYRQGRPLLVPVRQLVTKAAVTDGWGHGPRGNS
jgi:HTH-type transcriptional regulator/antitoxin HigA